MFYPLCSVSDRYHRFVIRNHNEDRELLSGQMRQHISAEIASHLSTIAATTMSAWTKWSVF
jgi:hypothetical protein